MSQQLFLIDGDGRILGTLHVKSDAVPPNDQTPSLVALRALAPGIQLVEEPPQPPVWADPTTDVVFGSYSVSPCQMPGGVDFPLLKKPAMLWGILGGSRAAKKYQVKTGNPIAVGDQLTFVLHDPPAGVAVIAIRNVQHVENATTGGGPLSHLCDVHLDEPIPDQIGIFAYMNHVQ